MISKFTKPYEGTRRPCSKHYDGGRARIHIAIGWRFAILETWRHFDVSLSPKTVLNKIPIRSATYLNNRAKSAGDHRWSQKRHILNWTGDPSAWERG